MLINHNMDNCMAYAEFICNCPDRDCNKKKDNIVQFSIFHRHRYVPLKNIYRIFI